MGRAAEAVHRWRIHWYAMKQRDDVTAVVHAHHPIALHFQFCANRFSLSLYDRGLW